jgi:hypothetical protein
LTDSAREEVQANGAPRKRRLKWVPAARERDWPSRIASTVLHAVVILLIILPSLTHVMIVPEEEGAGGPGPAGGGGGGNRGTGGVRSERIQYVSAAPAPVPPPVVVPPPRIIPPVVEEKKPEVVPPPVPTPPVAVEVAKVDSTAIKTAEATSVVAGTGGGSGDDGSNGAGPGKGGGKGSGEGTGTGSSVGPGTGGGTGTVYPPQVTQLVILPLPAPNKVKPYEMTAIFDVDSLGHATLIDWNQPKDRDYANKVLATLKGYRFRPAVRAIDGMPVRDTVAIRASIGK